MMPSLRALGYGTALFLTSAGGLVLEIVAGRLVAPVLGMSLYTWTSIIAAVLAGFSIGHWIGGRLAGPTVDARAGARRLAWALSLAAVSTLAILPLLKPVATTLAGEGVPFLAALVLIASLLFLPPSLFVGIVSPILTKLALDAEPDRAGPVLGRMYALGTVGSIAGTLAAGFLFISWIGSAGTVLAVALLYAVLAAAFAAHGRIWAAPGAAALLALALGAWGTIGPGEGAFRNPCQVESDYFCIRVTDMSEASGRPSAVLVLDHLEHSANDRDDPVILYNDYAHLIDELVRARRPDLAMPQVFFIGGGGYTLPRLWAEDYPGAGLTVAEIDPAVTRVARERLWVAERREIRPLHQDARLALQSLPPTPTFDLVIGDAFHDFAVPQHLITLEFNRAIAARLKPGGSYLLNLIDGGDTPMLLLAVVRTLAKVFPVVEVWTEAEWQNSVQRLTFVIVAGDRATEADEIVAQRGMRRRWLKVPDARLKAGVARHQPPILSDDYAPVDRLLAHIVLGAPAMRN